MKVFNYCDHHVEGSLTFETPMLFAVAFVILVHHRRLLRLMLAIAPADFQYHDTYFVVAHFHGLVPGAIFGIFASRLTTGCRSGPATCNDETLGKLHFWMSFIGMNLAFFRCTSSASPEDPRLQPAVRRLNMVRRSAPFMFGTTQLLFLFIVIKCIRGGKPAPC